jgi:uncharacterized Zn-binding protein involved in type VI secretion
MVLVPVAIIGSKSDHGGTVITGSPTFTAHGVPVARVGDMHDCPKHGKTPILAGSNTHTDNGTPFAHIGSKTGCGATIITGESRFTIELHQENPAPLNQESDEYDVCVKVRDSTTNEPLCNRRVLVKFQNQEKEMKTDANGELYLTHEQALTAQVIVDYQSPKQSIKHKDIHGE